MKQQIVPLRQVDGTYSGSDFFFSPSPGKRLSGHRIATVEQPENCNEVVLFPFPYSFWDRQKVFCFRRISEMNNRISQRKASGPAFVKLGLKLKHHLRNEPLMAFIRLTYT